MSWKYNYLDHTADIAVDIEASTVEELFIGAAFALQETICENNANNSTVEKEIKLSDASMEILLVSFLSELNYLFQSENWMFSSIREIKIRNVDQAWNLNAKIGGYKFDRTMMKLKSEIKAVTYHQMEIKEWNGKFSTRIVFDI